MEAKCCFLHEPPRGKVRDVIGIISDASDVLHLLSRWNFSLRGQFLSLLFKRVILSLDLMCNLFFPFLCISLPRFHKSEKNMEQNYGAESASLQDNLNQLWVKTKH